MAVEQDAGVQYDDPEGQSTRLSMPRSNVKADVEAKEPPSKKPRALSPRNTNTAGYEEQDFASTQLALLSQDPFFSGIPTTYFYKPEAGDGITVYVVDTGVAIVRPWIISIVPYGSNNVGLNRVPLKEYPTPPVITSMAVLTVSTQERRWIQ